MKKYFDNMHIVYSMNDFYEPERKLKHIVEKYSAYSQESIQSIVNIFKRIGELEKEKDKEMVFFDQEELIELFETNKWIMVGTTESKKTMVREYMRWYKEKEFDNWKDVDIRATIDQINISNLDSEDLYKTEWFKSFEELQNEIDVVLDLYEGVDIHELDTPIATIYLAWCGVNSREAVKIRKEHIAQVINQIYLPISQKYIKVNDTIIEFLRKYKEFDGYSILTKSGTKFCGYRDSGFLLRTRGVSNISEKTIWPILAKFADRYSESGKSKRFKYNRIQKSAKYLEIIEYEKQHGKLEVKDLDIFAELLENTIITNDNIKASFYNKFRNFQLYREYYYSDQAD